MKFDCNPTSYWSRAEKPCEIALYLLTSSSGNASAKGSTSSVVDRRASCKGKMAWACVADSVSPLLEIKIRVVLFRPILVEVLTR